MTMNLMFPNNPIMEKIKRGIVNGKGANIVAGLDVVLTLLRSKSLSLLFPILPCLTISDRWISYVDIVPSPT